MNSAASKIRRACKELELLLSIRKLFVAAAAAAALSACASTPNPLDLQTRNGVFLKQVATNWSVEDGKRAEKPEYVSGKEDLVARLKAAVETEFKNSPSGSEPIDFQIDIKGYSRVGALMGNMIGGSNMVIADVRVVRESDGKVLGVYQNVMGMYASNAGVLGAIAQAVTKPDIVGIMSNSFAGSLKHRFESKS
jgi:hypothetical protein